MPFKSNSIDIECESKLFALAILFFIGTLHKMKLQEGNIWLFYISNLCSFLLSKVAYLVTATTASAPRSGTLVQLVRYTLLPPLPVANICELEQTAAVVGIDKTQFWKQNVLDICNSTEKWLSLLKSPNKVG